jgi:cytochrome c-type biogenesis protein CcsB
MSLSDWADWGLLSASARWVLVTELLCLTGALLTVWGGVRHFLGSRAASVQLAGAGGVNVTLPADEADAGRARGLRGWSPQVAVLAAAIATIGLSLWHRYLEVNHFPSQTMSEVLTVFSAALLLSLFVLHFALGLYRRGPGWAILDDAMVATVLVGVLFTLQYIRGLSTAQRDLPPALQSYWFAPHISALIFSYATLSIAGIICLIWFTVRFWSGVFSGGRSRRSQIAILALLLLLPFVHFVTIPVLLLTGLLFLGLKQAGKLPSKDRLVGLERELDEVSFRAFAVGMPFLTAGLWMGAFWAQEAWANYWGWDSKENSALITWLIYVMYIHLRMLGRYRGEKAMAVLLGGALSVFLTFQVFGYLPDSQKNSLHKYTDEAAPPMEGQTGPDPTAQARTDNP